MPRRTMENRTIEVIMLESDKYLGEKFEIVRVKPIFAKNILLPRAIAVLATAGNLNNYKQKMDAAKALRVKKASGFEDMITKIVNDGGLFFEKKSNEKGVLYSKLDSREISEKISEVYSIKVDSHLFKMKKKIGNAGEFKVTFVYKELEKEVPITVKALVEKTKMTSMNKLAPIVETVEVVEEVVSTDKADTTKKDDKTDAKAE